MVAEEGLTARDLVFERNQVYSVALRGSGQAEAYAVI
jgi:hypothetical protein